MRFVAAFILLSLAISCNSEIEYPEGGYDYLKEVKSEDSSFYYLPLKKLITKRDSFKIIQESQLYKDFKEPNLSISPSKKDVFRLSWGGWGMPKYLITISENEIVAKASQSPLWYYCEDSAQLTEIEKKHLRIFQKFYPFEEISSTKRKRYVDSLRMVYPQLDSESYYRYLQNKVVATRQHKFSFSERRIKISRTQFLNWINELNKSEYWKLPWRVECDAEVTDGNGYILEASTQNKYNFVVVNPCLNGPEAFAIVCQKLLDLAQIKEYRIYY